MAVAQAFEIDVKQLNPVSRTQKKNKEQAKVHLLPRLTSGKDITNVIVGTDLFQVDHDTADDERAVNAMIDILKLFKRDIVRVYDAEPAERLKIEFEISQELKGLEAYGFYLFGIKRELSQAVSKQKTQTTMCSIYMSHSRSLKIIQDKKSNMMIPAMLSDVA